MSTYLTLGGKTLAELPAIPTDLSGNNTVSTIALTWTNNNIIAGCTNVIQLWNTAGSIWVDNSAVASGATGTTITGLTHSTSYKIR